MHVRALTTQSHGGGWFRFDFPFQEEEALGFGMEESSLLIRAFPIKEHRLVKLFEGAGYMKDPRFLTTEALSRLQAAIQPKYKKTTF